MTANKLELLWTRTFVFLCLAEFLGYAHNALLTPTLPLYVTHLGGSPFLVGVILAAFSVTSVGFRPFIGYWADYWSYIGVLALGTFLMGLSVLLWLIPLVGMLILANALRGTGWAGLNTGGYSLLANNAPQTRRGEAAGFYGGFQSIPHAIFPAVALWIINAPSGGFNPVILSSAALAFFGAGFTLLLKHPAVQASANPRPTRAVRQGPLRLSTFLDRNVLIAWSLLLCLHLPFPTTTSFLVLYAHEIGVEGVGWYFIATGSTQVLSRPILGLVADRFGRARAVAGAFVLEIIGLTLILLAPNLAIIIAGGVFYSAGTAMGTASTMAMAIDRAQPERRGVTMATFSTALSASMGLGALVAGAIVAFSNYTWMFVAAIAMAAAGLLITLINWPTLDSATPTR
jgi:MFS family permease